MSKIDEISEAFYHYSFKHYEEELKNSSQPSEKSFPNKSTFQENFQTNINAVHNDLKTNYPPEQAKYIYETLISNLMRQSQNPERSKIINSSEGTINVENLQNYSKKVEETLKVRHPEKFEVTNEQQLNSQKDNSTVDFNNPEEKKEFFNNLYVEYTKLQTFEEKKVWFSENFYNIGDLTQKEQEQALDAYEKGNEILQLYDKIEEENPEASNEELTKLKKEALENKAREENLSVDYLEKCRQYNELLQKIKLEQNKELKENYIEQAEKLRIELGISKEQQDKIINSENNINFTNENMLKNEEESNISDELGNSEIENEALESNEDFVMPGIEDEELETSEEFIMPEVEEQLKINTKVNAIVANVPEEDFKSDYTKEIQENPIILLLKNMRDKLTQRKLAEGQTAIQSVEEKPSLLNRFKNFVSKLSNGRNKTLFIDTAENNTKSILNEENLFNRSIAVSDEVKNNTVIAGKQTNPNNKSTSKSNKLEAIKGESISI